jgi:hypothetical protein
MSKYGNIKERGYASKREARRAQELVLLLKCGIIANLREQVPIELTPKIGKERASFWIADFVYDEVETGEEIWEDCKGARTALYILKRKIVLHRYGKTIRET